MMVPRHQHPNCDPLEFVYGFRCKTTAKRIRLPDTNSTPFRRGDSETPF